MEIPEYPAYFEALNAESVLHEYASQFHQDWRLSGLSLHEVADRYVRSRSLDKITELENFILALNEKDLSHIELLKNWSELGAHGWPKDENVNAFLKKTLDLINQRKSKQ